MYCLRKHSTNLSQWCSSCQQQTIRFHAWDLCIGANRGVCHSELTCERAIQSRIQCLLDLLVIVIHGEAEDAKQVQDGILHMHYQAAVSGSRGYGGYSGADVQATPIDIRGGNEVAAL